MKKNEGQTINNLAQRQKPSDKKNSLFDEDFFEEDEEEEDEDDDFDFDDEDDEDDEDEDKEDEEFEEKEVSEKGYIPPPPVFTPSPMPSGQMAEKIQNPQPPVNPSPTVQEEEKINTQDIQFRLGCELGQVLIPYDHLQNLNIGSVVGFNNTLQTLYLSVNNVRVGEGMLVDIDGKVGIKITRWYGKI